MAVDDTSRLLLYLYAKAFYTLGEGGEREGRSLNFVRRRHVPIMITWTVWSVLSSGAVWKSRWPSWAPRP